MTGAGSKPGTAPRMSAKRGGDRHPRCLAGLTVPTASYVATLRGLLERCSWRRRIFSFRLSASGARTVSDRNNVTAGKADLEVPVV